MTEAAMNADPLRMYIKTLRVGRGLSQPELARQAGMVESTYVAWERGSTKTIKEHLLRRVLRVLQGAREHLDMLDRMTEGEARAMALEWLELSPEEQARSIENHRKLQRVVELYDEDPQELSGIIETIRQEARADPGFIFYLNGLLAGRRGARLH